MKTKLHGTQSNALKSASLGAKWWKLNMTKEGTITTTVKRIGMVWTPFLWPLNILWLCCGRTLVRKLCICSAWLLVFWCLLRSSSSLLSLFRMKSLSSEIPNGCCISWSCIAWSRLSQKIMWIVHNLTTIQDTHNDTTAIMSHVNACFSVLNSSLSWSVGTREYQTNTMVPFCGPFLKSLFCGFSS